MLVKTVRSILGVLIGLFLITLLVEPLEFAIVTLVNGGVASDPDDYFAIRNRSWFLSAKFIYNTIAAVAGGFVCAIVAGRAPFAHAGGVAVLQTAGFGYALATPEMRDSAPLWMWIALIPLTIAGLFIGAWASTKRRPAGAGLDAARRENHA